MQHFGNKFGTDHVETRAGDFI